LHQYLYIQHIYILIYVYIITQLLQTHLQIRYKNLLFLINFSLNLKFSFSLFAINKNIYFKYKFNDFINKMYLILNIYKSRIKMEPSILITLIYYVYIFTKSHNIVEVYLSSLLLLTDVFFKLIKITNCWVNNNNQLKKYFPVFHSIIKYILFALLIIVSLILIIIGQKLLIIIIANLKKFFLNMDIKSKLKNLKLSLDYKWVKNNNKPNKPKGTFVFDLNNNNKENKKKVSYLKDKIFDAQKKNLNKNFTNTTFKHESFSQKRNWTKSINIEDNPKFTISEQINNVKSEFKAYNNQENKFKKIIVDINKKKEEFFPNESQSLFNEYVSVVKVLKKNLKSIEKTLSKNKN